MEKIFYKCITCQNEFELPQKLYYTGKLAVCLILFCLYSILNIFSVASIFFYPQSVILCCIFSIILAIGQIVSLCKFITYYVKADKSICPYCGSEYFTKHECHIIKESGELVDMAIKKRY